MLESVRISGYRKKKKMESVDICYGFRSDVALVPLQQEFNETWLETRPHPDVPS